ncbi:MAG: nicotinate-nucleotide--dimethylbenzimidazole phosphoribosyltransferase [Gemmatimonas sp.]
MTAGTPPGSTPGSTPSSTPSSFAEIRRLAEAVPGPDVDAVAKAKAREPRLTKPGGALGRLEELAEWLCAWQGRHPPAVEHPRVAVFAGNHGVAALGVSAYPPSVTEQMVQNFVRGGAAVNQLCKVADADLRVYEMALDQPTADFTREPALGEDACVRAMAYGMMAVEPGIDLLCLGEMGIANTTSASAIGLALYGGSAEDWTGPGTGVVGDVLTKKREVVAAGVARHRGDIMRDGAADPLAVLAALGGHELAGICGAVLAARLARVPVVLDGFTATVAAAVLEKLKPGLLDHCVVGHLSDEPAHRRICAILNKQPLLEFRMRLGEASGAALAIPLIRAAAACHAGMATFDEAGVDDKE